MIPVRSSTKRRRAGLTSQLQSGEFILRKSQTPDELVTALLDPGEIPYVDIAHQVAAASRTGDRAAPEAEGRAGARDGRPGVLRPRDGPAVDPARGLSVAAHGAGRRAGRRGSDARGLPVAGDLPGAARHERRGADPADARQVHRAGRRGAPQRREGPRDDVLRGPDARLDRRARGRAPRGEATDRRRLPEPDQRHQGRQEPPAQRRSDGDLRVPTRSPSRRPRSRSG